MKNLPFFLLPFFLFTTIITEAIGYYLCLFLYPFIYVIKYKIKIPNYIKTIGLILFFMYMCFIFSNFLNLVFPNPLFDSNFYIIHFNFWKLFHSRLPTSYLTTGLFLIVLFYSSEFFCSKQKSHFVKKNQISDFKPLESFLKGSLYAGIFFAVFFLAEFIFKLDYRNFHLTFQPKLKLSLNIAYHDYRRAKGFLANQLTLSSMSLAYFSFFYTYFCYCFFNDKTKERIPFAKNKTKLVIYTFIPSMLFLLVLFLTLSRTSIFISMIALFCVPFLSINKKNVFKIFVFTITFFILGCIVCHFLGYTERLLASYSTFKQQDMFESRAYLRKVYIRMFLDKPLIGNGVYWLVNGIRDKYFVLLGHGDFFERNFPAHNVYLEVLATGGLFCASTIIYGLWKLHNIVKQNIVHRKFSNETLWIAFLISTIVNLLHGFTQNNFLESSTTYVYLYLFLIIFWNHVFTNSQTKYDNPNYK